VYCGAVIERKARVASGQLCTGAVAVDLDNELCECRPQTVQKSEDLLVEELAFHHHKAHQVQTQITSDGLRIDRLADPSPMLATAQCGGDEHPAAPSRRSAARAAGAQHAATLKTA